jgi:Bacterial Ig-like domain (group 3)/Fibronectin type III domain
MRRKADGLNPEGDKVARLPAQDLVPRGIAKLWKVELARERGTMFSIKSVVSTVRELRRCCALNSTFLFVFALVCAAPAFASQVGMAWDPVSDGVLSGYYVYYGQTSHGYTVKLDIGNRSSFTVTNLTNNQKYYFAITAYNSARVESPFSNEINVVTQPPIATSTVVTTSANPVGVGTTLTFTAVVTGSAPSGTVQFADSGTSMNGCGTVAVTGSGNSRTAVCTTTNLYAGSHTIIANYAGTSTNGASSSAPIVEIVRPVGGPDAGIADPGTIGSTNVALAANGGVAYASSQYNAGYPVTSVNNNERAGVNWGRGGGWNDGTSGRFPDYIDISFAGSKTIDHVVVYTVQDNYVHPIEPTDTQTFTLYGVTDFNVQGWDGTAWVTLGSVSGNNLVKRTVQFTAFATSKIRINITGALAAYSRITEIEAWGN